MGIPILVRRRFYIVSVPLGPFYWHSLTLIPAWISNHTYHWMWDEITYPFPNFNGATVEVWEWVSNFCIVEVWEWVSNFIPHLIMGVITYPWLFLLCVLQAARRHSQGRKQMSWKNTCTLITVLQEPNISGKKVRKSHGGKVYIYIYIYICHSG